MYYYELILLLNPQGIDFSVVNNILQQFAQNVLKYLYIGNETLHTPYVSILIYKKL